MKITKEIRDFVSRTVITKVNTIQNEADLKKSKMSEKYRDAFNTEFKALRDKYEKLIQNECSDYKMVYNATSYLALEFVPEKKMYSHTYDNGISYDIINRVLAGLSIIKNVSSLEDIENIIDNEISKIFK